VVGRGGVERVLVLDLDPDGQRALYHSATLLHEVQERLRL
jgi:hypothetical protein